jgi:MOSC domain-containing protein YiiM
LLTELREAGFDVVPAAMGENITTRGVALLSLPTGTRVSIGADAVLELTGLRNPCNQLNTYGAGLMDAVLDCAASGDLVRKSGVIPSLQGAAGFVPATKSA